MRIVAGGRRGRRLKVPAGGGVRPTSEMVREAVFNVLGPVGGLAVLDLFAGSGALGLEALSRGASKCVFVEDDPAVTHVLRENIAALEYEPVSRVIMTDFRRAVDGLVRAGQGFDLLFVDPPYRMLAEVEVTLSPLLSQLLSEYGVVVTEGDRSSQVSFGQTPVFDRTYGETKITMVRMRRSIR
ncbi:MAG: 16S rRNA (guanine(966)-N(2))-methyltransferase RsmD [Actinobacteria bacterium RBG_16_64_13]|nr:MAG: 16S rRNA (guanine(966)-N(2))-methyltransferase RsmD [Actinobacteria bacterium RBG_16_64_13]